MTKTVEETFPPTGRVSCAGATPTPVLTGMFDMDRMMVPENPFRLDTVAMEFPEEPRARLMALGKRDRLKSGGGIKTTTSTEWLSLPLCATTVKV